MSATRIFRMTVASTWYDQQRKAAQEHEMHFKVARSGDIRRVRTRLAKRGIEYFQRDLYRRTRRWIPKRRIKARFEREEPALAPQRHVGIESRRIERRGRMWKAYRQASRMIGYAKKRYKRRIR